MSVIRHLGWLYSRKIAIILALVKSVSISIQPAAATEYATEEMHDGVRRDILAGQDDDGNGVRDEIDVFIAANFGGDAQITRGLSNVAIAFRYGLIATSVTESRRAHSMLLHASECLSSLGSRITAHAESMRQLDELIRDTPERKQAYEEHARRIANDLFIERIDFEWDETCDKRVDEVMTRGSVDTSWREPRE